MTDLTTAWRKSSRSGENGNSCVELAYAGRTLAVRDSKNPAGGVLLVEGRAAAGLLGALKAGRFDG